MFKNKNKKIQNNNNFSHLIYCDKVPPNEVRLAATHLISKLNIIKMRSY